MACECDLLSRDRIRSTPLIGCSLPFGERFSPKIARLSSSGAPALRGPKERRRAFDIRAVAPSPHPGPVPAFARRGRGRGRRAPAPPPAFAGRAPARARAALRPPVADGPRSRISARELATELTGLVLLVAVGTLIALTLGHGRAGAGGAPALVRPRA